MTLDRRPDRVPDAETLDSLELLHQAQRGDLEAYGRLFERHYPRVLEMVRRRLGSGLRRSLESGDLTQDAMVEAIRSFETFDVRSKGEFVSWLARIVENRIRDAAKRTHAAKRDPEKERALRYLSESTASGILRFEAVAEDPAPPQEVAEREEREILLECLAELDERYRRVIELRHADESPWDEISAALGSPSVDAARMLYQRAKIELRKAVVRRIGGHRT